MAVASASDEEKVSLCNSCIAARKPSAVSGSSAGDLHAALVSTPATRYRTERLGAMSGTARTHGSSLSAASLLVWVRGLSRFLIKWTTVGAKRRCR